MVVVVAHTYCMAYITVSPAAVVLTVQYYAQVVCKVVYFTHTHTHMKITGKRSAVVVVVVVASCMEKKRLVRQRRMRHMTRPSLIIRPSTSHMEQMHDVTHKIQARSALVMPYFQMQSQQRSHIPSNLLLPPFLSTLLYVLEGEGLC